MEWKYSSAGMRALAFGVSTMQCHQEALAAMRPETRAALERPQSAPWHDGALVIDAAEAVQRFAGDAGVEDMNYQAVKRSLGPLVAPFVKISLTLFGAQPGTIYARMNENLTTVMKGVRTEWVQAPGAKQGRLTITHPDDIRPIAWPSWTGSLRFTFDLCGVAGTITPVPGAATIRTVVFDASWP
jgi:hypothetical protein